MIASDFSVDLQNAVTEVLESMCFISVIEETTVSAADKKPWVARRLAFRGPFAGHFGLRVPLETATIFAGNLLGQETEELTEQEIGDSVGEIANMICGSFLCKLETEHPFDLTTPVADPSSDGDAESTYCFAKDFVVEGGLLHTWLQVG
jgi:CheY-specific phosphatase CheX